MSQSKQELYKLIEQKLSTYKSRSLSGITSAVAKDCLIKQIIDSIRRIEYVTVIRDKDLTEGVIDPNNEGFNPIKAASWHRQAGNIDEAFWLIFLSTHFGKNLRTGWNLVKDVYGKLGTSPFWDWDSVSQDPIGFRVWLNANINVIKANGKVGNHRKYQSIDAYKPSGTGAAIESYVNWIGPNRSHQETIESAIVRIGSDPRDLFNYLYKSMNAVISFGRTARFDYLTMVGKIGLADIEPGSTYMNGATGPYDGGKMLFGANVNRTTINDWLIDLEDHLNLYFGMQVLEDSVCNWQKSPQHYRYFGG